MEEMAYLSKNISIIIDRPLGSKHPKFNWLYPVNYGYVPFTVTGDGEEIDAYLLGVEEAVDRFEGKCIAVIHRKNDDENKLVVVPKGYEITKEEIRERLLFQECHFESDIIIKEVK